MKNKNPFLDKLNAQPRGAMRPDWMREERRHKLGVGASVTLVGNAAFFWGALPPVFFIANVGTAITWSFVVPYIFGILSRLDPSGRQATLGGFVSKLGLASGPMLAGWVLRGDDFRLLIAVAISALALSTVALLAAARREDQLEPHS